MLLGARAYNVPESTILPYAFLVETIHNATLIIDDIEDSSTTRKGGPCSYLKYGVDSSINTGNYLYYAPLNNLIKSDCYLSQPSDKREAILAVYIEEMHDIHLGLGLDIEWHKNQANFPNENQYLQMIDGKTSVLFRMGMRILAILGDLDKEETVKLVNVINKMGQSFQIVDDLLNLTSSEFAKGKGGLGEDITEGKLSLMMIDFLNQRGPNQDEMLQILSKGTTDPVEIKRAIQLVQDSGSIDYAKKRAKQFKNQGLEALKNLSIDQEDKDKIKSIFDFMISRKI